jgi:hypothetical protein
MLPGLYQSGGLFNQVVDTLIKMAEAFVFRLSAMKPHIDLLQDNR